MKKFLKAVGIIFLVLIILLFLAAAALGITGAVIIDKATSTQESAPSEFEIDENTDLQKIIGKTFLNKLTNSYVEITEGNINYLLQNVGETANIQNAKIEYINIDLNEDHGSVYAAVTLDTGYKIIDKTFPVKADFSLDYTEKLLSVEFKNITIGSIAIDEKILSFAKEHILGKYIVLPEWAAINGANVTASFDCSKLDSLVESIFLSNWENEEFIARFGDYGRALKHVPAERLYLVIDINLKDLLIEEGKVKFNATIINVNELFYEGGAAAMDEFGIQFNI